MHGSHKSQRHTWTYEFGNLDQEIGKTSGTKNKHLEEIFNNW